eukprot:gene19895-20400_t
MRVYAPDGASFQLRVRRSSRREARPSKTSDHTGCCDWPGLSAARPKPMPQDAHMPNFYARLNSGLIGSNLHLRRGLDDGPEARHGQALSNLLALYTIDHPLVPTRGLRMSGAEKNGFGFRDEPVYSIRLTEPRCERAPMADAKSMERIVLKVLSGVQAGAEVSLPPGEYTLGSGAEDDIQFVDVSLKPKHARLRLGGGKIEIIGTSGTLTTANGLSLAADADGWQEIEPLDVITAGTMRFALGLPRANWTSLGDAVAPEAGGDHPRARRRPGGSQQAAKRMPAGRMRQYALPVVLLALVGGSAAYLLSSSGDRTQTSVAAKLTDLQLARQAFDTFIFGKAIQLKQEVDGTIYASGYVESPVERRALMGAVEKAGLQVRFRVSVLQSMRSEVDNLIKASKLPLTFQLTEGGTLVLEGLILKEEVMQKFVDRLTTDVTGIAQFENHIRTAKSLLAEIEKLGRMAQIDQYVVLRLDNDLIEINGILPADKTDAWVGFLQSYSRRFGKDI